MRSVLINAVPNSSAELARAGQPIYGLSKWQSLKSEIDLLGENHFAKTVHSKEAALEELVYGETDVVIAVAHSDGYNLYINGGMIEEKDLRDLPEQHGKKPRTVILLSCLTGEVTQKKKLHFWQKRQSFAEILVEKGLFSEAIAPAKEIDDELTVELLKNLIDHKSTDFFNKLYDWNRIAILIKLKKEWGKLWV